MPRASTSRGSTSSGPSTDFQIQDFSFLLEQNALDLIQLNRLKLVPIDQEDPSAPCNNCEDSQLVRNERDLLKTRLGVRDTEVTELRRRVIELEDEIVPLRANNGDLRNELEETNQAYEELQVRLTSQADTFNELQNECQMELEEERRRREEAERNLEERDARLRQLENQLREQDTKFQERERVIQENMARGRCRIIVLSDEKERITQERFRFSGFARQVKILLGYRDPDGDDLLVGGQLERIFAEVKKLKEHKNQDLEKMDKNRELLKKIFEISGLADVNQVVGGRPGGNGGRTNAQNLLSPPTSSTSSSSSSTSTATSSPTTSTSYFRINNDVNRSSLFLSKNPTPPPQPPPSLSVSSQLSSVPPTPPSTPVTPSEIPSTSFSTAAAHPAAIRIRNAPQSPLSPNLAEPSTSTCCTPPPPPQQNDAMDTSIPAASSPSPSPTQKGVASVPSSTPPKSSLEKLLNQTTPVPQSSPSQITIINSYSLATTPSKSQNKLTIRPSVSPSIVISPKAIVSVPPPTPVLPTPTPPPPPPPPAPENPNQSKRGQNPHFNRNGQLTEYSVSSKQHGVNRASAKFRCLCENEYTNEKSLNVHIRKMKTAWKYKCNKCLHYFFYKSDLTRHLARSSKCSQPSEPNGSASFLNDTLFDELIGVRGPSAPPPIPLPPPPPQPGSSGTTTTTAMQLTIPTSSGNRQGTFTKSKHQGKRKLQQEILKRKKHAPWVSKNGAVQGSWYCVCGSKFGLRASMQTHVQYFTQDWKFQCDRCPETFLYLAYLKKHLASTHKIKGPLKEYNMGCQLCGSIFKKRSDYYRHRKIIHNLLRRRPKATVPPPPPKSPEKSNAPLPPQLPTIPLPPPSITVIPNPDPQPGPSGVAPKVKPIEIIDVPSDDEVEMIPLSPPPITVTIKQERAPSPSPSTYSSISSADSIESSASGEGQNHAQVEPDPLYVDASNPNAQLFSCECGKTYKSRSALGLHIKTMKFGNIYVCMTCNKGFRQLINLKNHMTCVHRDVYRGFYCGLCKMQFTSSRLFKIHRLKVHDN